MLDRLVVIQGGADGDAFHIDDDDSLDALVCRQAFDGFLYFRLRNQEQASRSKSRRDREREGGGEGREERGS
jgi:hypothetical protein